MLLHAEDFKNWGIGALDWNLTQNMPRLYLIASVRAAWRTG